LETLTAVCSRAAATLDVALIVQVAVLSSVCTQAWMHSHPLRSCKTLDPPPDHRFAIDVAGVVALLCVFACMHLTLTKGVLWCVCTAFCVLGGIKVVCVAWG